MDDTNVTKEAISDWSDTVDSLPLGQNQRARLLLQGQKMVHALSEELHVVRADREAAKAWEGWGGWFRRLALHPRLLKLKARFGGRT